MQLTARQTELAGYLVLLGIAALMGIVSAVVVGCDEPQVEYPMATLNGMGVAVEGRVLLETPQGPVQINLGTGGVIDPSGQSGVRLDEYEILGMVIIPIGATSYRVDITSRTGEAPRVSITPFRPELPGAASPVGSVGDGGAAAGGGG